MQPCQRSVPRCHPAVGATLAWPLGRLLAQIASPAGGGMNFSPASTHGEHHTTPEGPRGSDGWSGRRPLLEAQNLKKRFPIVKGLFSRVSGQVRAVDGVSFHIGHGETLGLVGESGCGKSTVGRTLLRLLEPSAGTIKVDGLDITGLDAKAMQPYRKRLQMIYQDPYASLNPRMTAAQIVGEPLVIHGVGDAQGQRERVAYLV